jgi:hypothetical protein
MSPVTVVILALTALPDGRGVEIEYQVRNRSRASIWLVDDGFLSWHQSGAELELSYARERMRPGAQPFGYYDPKVVELAPGARLNRKVQLTWPQPLDRLWNPVKEGELTPGEHPLKIKIGYGHSSKPPDPKLHEGVEAPVLRWQNVASSAAVTLKVP